MRPLFLTPVSFVVVSFFFGSIHTAEDLSFCFGRNSICAIGSGLFDLCHPMIDDPDTAKWYECICGNGYVSVSQSCYWCQLAYGIATFYTDVSMQHCLEENIYIAPIPQSVLPVGSSYNITYTGIISDSPQTDTATPTPATTTPADSTRTKSNGGISVPPRTTSSDSSTQTADSDSSDPTAAPSETPSDIDIITKTVPSMSRAPRPTNSQQNEGQDPVERSSKSSGLSTGAKAGIGVGCVLLTLLLSALVWVGIILSRISKQRAARNDQVPRMEPYTGMAELGNDNNRTQNAGLGVKFWLWGRSKETDAEDRRRSEMPSALSTTTPVSPLSGNVSPPPQKVEVAPAANFSQGPEVEEVHNMSSQPQQVCSAYSPPDNFHQGPQASELHGASVMVPPGVGLPPDRG